ncbi:MAG: helix-turn-helix domain-containing protein [Acidobacteria bacterium]|nr:helix-turn-helix domain-containing protein [Acidobacteriota bacterium]
MDTPNDLVTTAEARALLGISAATMAKLLKRGRLIVYEDPLDERKKLISKRAVLALIVPRAKAA